MCQFLFLISCCTCNHRQKPLCIPVMGFGYNDDPLDFVPRLLRSVDFCVDHLIVVAPQRMEGRVKEMINSLNLPANINVEPHFFPWRFVGVAETWNYIIRASPDAPWFLICAYDVQFLPMQLEMLSQRFWKRSGNLSPGDNVTANIAHTRWLNMPGGKGFNLFALSREVVGNVGLFDENIYPAFWEDRDYLYRVKLWSGARIRTFGDIRPIHGLFTDDKGVPLGMDVIRCLSAQIGKKFKSDCGVDAISSNKYISGTRHVKEKALKNLISVGDKRNFEYVIRKWGCDKSTSKRFYDLKNCTYITPFNSGNLISYWIQNETESSLLHRVDSFYK